MILKKEGAMRKFLVFALLVFLVLGFSVLGCGQKKAASSKEAIEASKAKQAVQEKVDFLIAQAKAFYNSRDFQGVVETTQYILSYLDKNSKEARNLLEKAKSQLKETASKALGDMQQKIDNW
jgi:hypothetical protein